MSKIFDVKNSVGAYDISTTTTGVAFDLLDPNNPVYVMGLPGLDEPLTLSGQDYPTFADMLKALDVKCEVDIQTGDEDNPEQTINLTFEKMSDFKKAKIIERVTALKKLQDKKELVEKMLRKAANNSKFKTVFENPEAKEALLDFVDLQISRLKNS